MALTRAQLLSGNQSNGVVLPGQPQGVIAGPGITISNTGIISVDSSSVTGLVKLNDPFAYNSYVWPGADGTAGEFLQTDGAGNLDWATPQGFAVVTVKPTPAPTPADKGELWFDCSSGTLNVYQDCVGGTGWFNVAQPGFPVLPGSTNALPPFTNQGTPGAGTQANPYDCSITTVSSGSSTFIVNTVTVNGLAPFQYVPIVDLNAVANLGRFSFSNYYANASGVLTFQIIFKDLPSSGSGITYTAAIRVGYSSAYIDAIVNVTLPLTLTGGTISGTPASGTQVLFTPPVASGGSGGYTYTYQWFANGSQISGATASAFTPTSAQVGQVLSVLTTVTDSSGATASTTTTASAATVASTISGWTPTGSMTTIPGGLTGTYTGAGTTITATGCIEVSINGGSYGAGGSILSGQTMAIRWKTTVGCGGGPTSATPITGTLTDGIGTNSYSVAVNRVPAPPIVDLLDTNVALGATVSKGIATPISGLTTPAFVTYVGTSTGGSIGASLTPGGPFTPLATSGTGFQIDNLQTLYIEQTAGGTVNTAPGYTAIIRVGDGTNTAGTYDEFTYFAQTVSSAVFPGVSFSPVGSPNAAPETLNGLSGGTTVGTLYGFVSSNAWPVALSTSLSSPASGGNPTMKMRVGAAAYATSGVSIGSGQTLDLAWNQAYLDTVSSGNVASGSIQGTVGSTTYTNTFSFTVKRTADFTVPSPTPSGASGAITINSQIPNDYNVPVKLYQTVPGGNALQSVTVDLGAGPVSLPTSPGTALTLNPGQSVTFAAVAPAGPATYSTRIHIGDTFKDWQYQVTVTPTVTQPDILNPNDGATNLNPALASPAGITVDTDIAGQPGGFNTNYGGTQVGADWYIYKAIAYNPTTSAITGVVPQVLYGLGWTSTLAGTTENTFVVGSPQGSLGPSTANGSLLTWTYSRSALGLVAGDVVRLDVITLSGSFVADVSFYGGGYSSTLTYTIQAGDPDAFTFSVRKVSGPVTTYPSCDGIYIQPGGNVGLEYRLLDTPNTTLTLTDATDLADMVVGDTVTQDSPYTPTTSVITGVSSAMYSNGLSSYTPGTFPVLDPQDGFDNNSATTASISANGSGIQGGMRWTSGSGVPPIVVPVGKSLYLAFSTNSGVAGAEVNGSTVAVADPGVGTNFVKFIDGPVTVTSFVYWRPDNGCNLNAVAVGSTTLGAGPVAYATVAADGGILVDIPTTLTLTDTTDLSYFAVGNAVTEVGSSTDASGTIGSIDSVSIPPTITLSSSSGTWSTGAQVRGPSSTGTGTITAISTTSPFSLTLSPSTGAWGIGKTAIDTSRTVIPPAPPALPPTVPDNTKYQAVSGFPLNITTAPFNEAFIPQADLTTSSKYYASVIYTGSGGTPVVSQAANWSSFETASSFLPAIGSAMGGGFFGGQINDGGIIYNLIVAPVAGGQSGGSSPTGIQWKNASSSDSNPPSQNVAYGFPMSQVGFAAGAATYPALHFSRSVTAGGYNDWYLPAKNELAILYYFLKPNSAGNDTSSGSNANSVAPYTPNTNYSGSAPVITSSSLFNNSTAGAQAFDPSFYYWSSSEIPGTAANANRQDFASGLQASIAKTTSASTTARAIRREYANAPVAIGDVFGGGFFAGQYVDPNDGLTYNLIVAPRVSGSLIGEYSTDGGVTPGSVSWRSPSGTGDANPPSQNTAYGKPATDQFGALGVTYPLFNWCLNSPTGPNGGAGIGGFGDWYIPALDELGIICWNLGSNWTSSSAFAGGAQAFQTAGEYWSATQNSGAVNEAWRQRFGDGSLTANTKASGSYARAVRRQLA